VHILEVLGTKYPTERWRIGTSEETEWLIQHADRVTYIKKQRIRGIRHFVKMDRERTVTSVTEWRRIGKQRFRWAGDVREDLAKLKIQLSSTIAIDREA